VKKLVIPPMKVRDIPPFDSVKELGVTERKEYGLYLSGGGLNDYRIAMATGIGGSRSDATFDKLGHRHTCCGSKAPWRHKVACPLLQFTDSDSGDE